MIYLDNAATTKPHPEILTMYDKLLKTYFVNKEGLYNEAVELEKYYEASKTILLKLMNLNDYKCVYTSGASESNNFVIKGLAFRHFNMPIEIITTKIEHPSVLSALHFLSEHANATVHYLNVNNQGEINEHQLQTYLNKKTALCLFSSVNSELGFCYDLEPLVKIIRQNAPHCHIHLDAVQGFAKVTTDYNLFDSIAISAHKVNGLKGSGALFLKRNIDLVPLIHGGQQEMGLRGGTVDACHHLMFAKTARLALENQTKYLQAIQEINLYLRLELAKIPDVIINSPSDSCSPFILNFSLVGYAPEVVVHALEDQEILIATKSACSSKKSVSHVLDALDLTEPIKQSALRLSFSYYTTIEEIDHFIIALKYVIETIKTKE